MKIDPIPVRAYSNKELAFLYGISVKILRRWLSRHADLIGPKEGRYFNGYQVSIIFEKLGIPPGRVE